MATGGYYGRMRATDADREQIHQILQSAYADGRLTWDEFDSRSTALIQAKTYDQLAPLTADLRQPVAYQPPAYPVRFASGRTNALAAVSLGFGVGQMFLPFVGAIIAIVCGHIARSQIRQTGDYGTGLATAGLVLGYLGLALPFLLILFAFAVLPGS